MNKSRLLLILLCLYVAVAMAAGYGMCRTMHSGIIEFYKSVYRDILDNIKEDFEKIQPEDIEDPDKLSDLFDLKYSYGFVYRDNMVIYETNAERTEKYKNSTARELFNDYYQQSGDVIVDNMVNIMNNESGTDIFIKNNEYGEEMLIWDTANVYGKSYVIGIALPVETILNWGDYYFYRNAIFLYNIINCAIMSLLVLILKNKIS